MFYDIREIKSRLTVSSVIGEFSQVVNTGGKLKCKCPLHGENTASMTIDDIKGTFHCFGCGAHGDILDFIEKINNTDRKSAMAYLAEKCGVVGKNVDSEFSSKALLHSVNMAAAVAWHDFLINSNEAESARGYLESRGVSMDVVGKFKIGFAPDRWNFISSKLSDSFPVDMLLEAGLCSKSGDGKGVYDRFRNRIMFPIMDTSGKVCGFSGRIIGDGQPKYMNSSDTLTFKKGSLLFGLHQAASEIRRSRQAIIVEGNFDIISLVSKGIENVVAPLGTALTIEQLHTLHSYCKEAVLMFDGDDAGVKAAKRAVAFFLAEDIEGKVAMLPAGHDPDSFTRGNGVEAIRVLINNAQPLPDFVFDSLVKEHGTGLAGKSRIMTELETLIGSVVGKSRQRLMSSYFGSKLGIGSLEVKEQHESVDKDKSITLEMDDWLINPGGLIGEGIDGLSSAGLPRYWQYNLPVVLSVLGRVATGKIRIGTVHPNTYHVKIAGSGTGKTESNKAMIAALNEVRCNIIGPSKFNSGPSIWTEISRNNNLLSIIDEVGDLLDGDLTKGDMNAKGKVTAILEAYSGSGGKYVSSYADREKTKEIEWFAFSLLGNTTPLFIKTLNVESIRSGLIGRINFFCRHGKMEPRGVAPQETSPQLIKFAEAVSIISRADGHRDTTCGAYNLSTASVQNSLRDLEAWIIEECNKDIDNECRNSLITRTYEYALKYTMIHMISSRPLHMIYDPVEEVDIRYGIGLAMALTEWKTEVLLSNITSSDFEADCLVFLQGCRAAYARRGHSGKPTIKGISQRKKEANWPLKRWYEIRDYLEASGKIVVERSGGKEYYIPC